MKPLASTLIAALISLHLSTHSGQAPLIIKAEVWVARGTVGQVCLIVEDQTSSCWDNFAPINTRVYELLDEGTFRVFARLITRDDKGKYWYHDTPVQSIEGAGGSR